MWNMQEEMRELLPARPSSATARLLLIRCQLVGEARGSDQGRRHQSIVMERLLRGLAKVFGARDTVAQINESDILIILVTRGLHVAAVLIRQAIAEVREHFLGEGPPKEEFTIESMTIRPGGGIETAELAGFDDAGQVACEQLRSAPIVGPTTITGAAFLDPGPLQFAFTPMRDLKKRAITTYGLRCLGEKSGVGTRKGYDILHGGESSSHVTTLDLQILKRAEAELALYHERSIPFLLNWTVHARTIDVSDQFPRYAKILAAIAAFARDRIVIELVGLHHDWPMSRMQEAIGLLRQYARTVMVRQSIDCTCFGEIAACGAGSVSVVLKSDQDEVQLLPQLARFCDGAARYGLTAVAQQVGTRSVAVMAAAAGFDHLHADYLGEQFLHAQPAAHFELADLFPQTININRN